MDHPFKYVQRIKVGPSLYMVQTATIARPTSARCRTTWRPSTWAPRDFFATSASDSVRPKMRSSPTFHAITKLPPDILEQLVRTWVMAGFFCPSR